ncbi:MULTISPECIES: hypothetical protein [unclassified Streptomyces]|uniref:hypothetical protein n=1 Tax=unclassified Streptomyces TaxID=2593676 RepID=UPI000DC7E237|nr:MULTISPECIES: hypothetical protein [unclassified Streptomyces]AWZ10610.1 hypothetical protein DRB89_29145 [Streptomyces sp. ICC4]AWZ17971.1 hypothetical protein DRB96_15480 [Streptomyces sp. ICC1]
MTRTSTRMAGVLTGLALALGGAALTAPAAHADVSACINQVERELQGGEAPASVRASCYIGSAGAQDECVSGLTVDNVTKATAEAACKAAAK